jgi:hypothetical protein
MAQKKNVEIPETKPWFLWGCFNMNGKELSTIIRDGDLYTHSIREKAGAIEFR